MKIDKLLFVLSVAVLWFLVGNMAGVLGMFPSAVVRDALSQARQLAAPPEYLRPRAYDRSGARWVSDRRSEGDLTLVTSLWRRDGVDTPGLKLLDRQGRVLHEWWVDASAVFPDSVKRRFRGIRNADIQGSLLLPGGDILVNIEYLGSIRLDACSRPEWSIALGNHHSIAPSEDGASFWVPGVTPKSMARTEAFPEGYPGLDRPLFQDLLLQLSPTGEVLSSLSVLDVLYSNGLEYHLMKAAMKDREDPTHVNDVEPLPSHLADEYPLFETGDLVVSVRNPDLVMVVDPRDGTVKWSETDPFLQQHDPDFLGDGWIGVFDNRRDDTRRGSRLGGSRIVAVQPHTDSVRVLFPGPESDPFYTSIRGKWQPLDNGNMILVESEVGRVIEVDSLGRTEWEWIVEPWDDDWVPYVTDAVRVDLTEEQVGSWPCSLVESPRAGGER